MVLLIWGSFQRKCFIPSGAVPRLRGFCFSFVLFQRKFIHATALAILCLCLLPCCSRLTRKYLWLLLVPRAGPWYAHHVLSSGPPGDSQHRYVEVGVLHFPGVSIFKVMPDRRSRGEDLSGLGVLVCAVSSTGSTLSPDLQSHTTR